MRETNIERIIVFKYIAVLCTLTVKKISNIRVMKINKMIQVSNYLTGAR